MDILVLGGTQMVGRDFVETIQNNYSEYRVYIANRGITNSNLFPKIKHISIDRNNSASCSVLDNYKFDTVLDFSCYTEDQYKNTIKYIHCNKYILISTQSVLDNATLNKTDRLDAYYWYCVNKKKLEEYVLSQNSQTTIVVRPGAIYGFNDYTNRFEYRDGKFYWKNTNLEPSQLTGCVYIKDFTKYLIDQILNTTFKKTTILQIP
jgi:nucleoside-diphosphate-sugar epimerase